MRVRAGLYRTLDVGPLVHRDDDIEIFYSNTCPQNVNSHVAPGCGYLSILSARKIARELLRLADQADANAPPSRLKRNAGKRSK